MQNWENPGCGPALDLHLRPSTYKSIQLEQSTMNFPREKSKPQSLKRIASSVIIQTCFINTHTCKSEPIYHGLHNVIWEPPKITRVLRKLPLPKELTRFIITHLNDYNNKNVLILMLHCETCTELIYKAKYLQITTLKIE